MKKFAVIGSPINHSFSPKIHSIFGQQTGVSLIYNAVEILPKNFSKQVMNLFNEGYDGLNITLPLKSLAYKFSNFHSEESKESESVNTLWKEGETFYGDTTDGKGFLKDLSDKSISLHDVNLLLVGAGGSARAILPNLIKENPKEIKIINRTSNKAFELSKKYQGFKVKISSGNLKDTVKFGPHGIINTSSVGTLNEKIIMPKGSFAGADWAYDLSYSDKVTAFNSLARQRGVKELFDGFGMLVHQAALSFEIWTGHTPDVKATIRNFK